MTAVDSESAAERMWGRRAERERERGRVGGRHGGWGVGGAEGGIHKKGGGKREFHLQSSSSAPSAACTQAERGPVPFSPAGVSAQVIQLRLMHNGSMKVHRFDKKKKKKEQDHKKRKQIPSAQYDSIQQGCVQSKQFIRPSILSFPSSLPSTASRRARLLTAASL